MTTTTRKPLPKSARAAEQALRSHLTAAGFGEGRGGLVITTRDGRVHVGVARREFPDAREMRKLTATLEDFTRVRLVDATFHGGDMFDGYTFTRVIPDTDRSTTVEPGPTDTVTVTVTVAEYEKLRDAARRLAQLEAAGVDNWEGYDDALRDD